MIYSLDTLSTVLALSAVGMALHVLYTVWHIWRSGGVR